MRFAFLVLVLPLLLSASAADRALLSERMRAHWSLARSMSAAVVLGELDVVRASAHELAALPDDAVPPELRPSLDQMRAAASRVENAESYEDATAAVAELGGACAACHRAHGGGPSDEVPSRPPSGWSHRRMERHQLAADWMWLGLVRPSQSAWDRGARDLARVLPDTDPGPSFADSPLEAYLRETAARAVGEADPQARVRLTTELLGVCVECHRLVGEDPGGASP